MKCVAITLKGVRCKNEAKVGDYCTLHSNMLKLNDVKPQPTVMKPQPTVMKPQPTVKKPQPTVMKPQPTVKKVKTQKSNMIFNPYYGKYVEYRGPENCSLARDSLKRVSDDQKNGLFITSYCDVLPLSEITNVVGPVSYNEYRYKNYNIGVFGEYHNINAVSIRLGPNDTLNFSSFMQSVITQNSRQFDLFLEKPYQRTVKEFGNVSQSATIFNIIGTDFKNCLTLIKNCPFMNLRAHYIDYRPIMDESEYGKSIDDIYKILFSGGFSVELISDMAMELLVNASKIYKSETARVKKFIKSDKKILKQLANCPLKNEIVTFINDKMIQYRKEFELFLQDSAIAKFLQKPTTKPTQAVYDKFPQLIDVFLNMAVSVMDIYALARMFRTFGKTSKEDPENIIVYVGEAHAKTYREFLKYIDAQNIIKKLEKVGKKYVSFSSKDKAKSFMFNDS